MEKNDPGSCLIAILFAPRGVKIFLQGAMWNNTLTSGGVKMKVLSTGPTPLPCVWPISLHNVLFKVCLYVSARVLEDPTDNHSSLPPLFTVIQAFTHTRSHSILRAIFPPHSPVSSTRRSVFSPARLFHCEVKIPSVGIMTTINSISTNVIKLSNVLYEGIISQFLLICVIFRLWWSKHFGSPPK